MSDFSFRELYFNLLRYEGDNAYQEVLLPCQDDAIQVTNNLKKYGDIEAKTWKIGKPGEINEDLVYDLWILYALSRVNDVLLLSFQRGVDNEAGWKGPNLNISQYRDCLTSLGMHPIESNDFHPFFHEIVEVDQSPEPSEPISLVDVIWPGYMLGNMLFSRAGVKVRGGNKYIRKEIAENSTLYFTFRRKNRPVSDLSHGWGSNSQWRTVFRRDYEDEEAFYYNVDGKQNPLDLWSQPGPPHPDYDRLGPTKRVELLTNRCFILADDPHEDQWPFYDTYIQKK